ncbi:kinase-like domain-containing protein [Syncephalis plumigaleata]|nr:kinase-like domain-containing protein [Syncephalis plumigaleata]
MIFHHCLRVTTIGVVIGLCSQMLACSAGSTQSQPLSATPDLTEYGLQSDDWKATPRKNVYIAKTRYNNMLAFAKCNNQLDEYEIEKNVYAFLSNPPIQPEQCKLPNTATSLLLRAMGFKKTNNGFGCIFLETADDAEDLYEYIRSTNVNVRYKNAIPVFYKIVTGISYLHCLGIAHMDIKPENILIYNKNDAIPQLKVIDYAIIRNIARSQVQPIHCSTLGYCAPEVFKNNPISPAVKQPVNLPLAVSWSIAATMEQAASNNHLVHLKQLVESTDDAVKSNHADKIAEFTMLLMFVNPNDRYTPERVFSEKLKPYLRTLPPPNAPASSQSSPNSPTTTTGGQ